MMPQAAALPRRFGLIGCGRIGRPIVDAWLAGELPGWTLGGVLTRANREFGTLRAVGDVDTFLASGYDLIIECAGPGALAEHGVRALRHADVWSTSSAALADTSLFQALLDAGGTAGHRLRIVGGAIAGLDGVAMCSVDPDALLHLDVDLPPAAGPRAQVFKGTVRDAARRYPDSVNVAVAAALALAGPGLDRSQITLSRPGPVSRHRLALTVASRHANLQAVVEPRLGPGSHPVAACLIANLRRELQTIWVG